MQTEARIQAKNAEAKRKWERIQKIKEQRAMRVRMDHGLATEHGAIGQLLPPFHITFSELVHKYWATYQKL